MLYLVCNTQAAFIQVHSIGSALTHLPPDASPLLGEKGRGCHPLFRLLTLASRVEQWSKAVLAVPLEILGSSPGSVTAGRNRETHGPSLNWPSIVQFRGGVGWPGYPCLISSSDSCDGSGTCTLTRSTGVKCFLRHIGAAGFRVQRHCVKKHCGLAGLYFGGRTAFTLCLSQVRTGVAAMGQDCNYQSDTKTLGRKRDTKKS